MDRSVADPMIGRTLENRYLVGPRIARGGMATVYEATDLRLDRVCALKVMHTGLGDDAAFSERFVREARSAARLSHPHVVAVFDQGDDHGTLFLAMEYIPGHTLRDVVRKDAPLAPAKALALLDPVLSALGAAHEAGMIHRDVKPENVLLADDGRVKVADFGLARAVSAETQHSATGGVLIGTVSYLSPELVVDGRADARSDVYAAGVILYELLTGRKPHEGDSPIQVAYKHVHEDVPAPSALVSGVPDYVDALVARATARDRELRPADARVMLHQLRRVRAALDHHVSHDEELAADLRPSAAAAGGVSIDYVSDEAPTIVEPGSVAAPEHTSVIDRLGAPPSSPPASPPPSPPTPRRRSRRGPLLLALVVLLALVAGGAGWWLEAGRFTSTPGVINLSRSQAEQKVTSAGLAFEVDRRDYSETVAAGSVISTDPGAGADILPDGTVSAVLSLGPERYDVPSLRGMSEDQAQETLTATNLAFGESTERFHETVADGVVLGSSPAAGTELKSGAAVDLVLSKGPRPVTVPDFTGKDAEAATAALEKRGLEVETSEANDETVPEGDVLSQSPRSGTLFRGDTVELTVSTGPILVEVPAVVGVGVAEATQRLEDAGFTVRTERSEVYVGLEFVVDCSPGQSTEAPEGSEVTLFLV